MRRDLLMLKVVQELTELHDQSAVLVLQLNLPQLNLMLVNEQITNVCGALLPLLSVDGDLQKHTQSNQNDNLYNVTHSHVLCYKPDRH